MKRRERRVQPENWAALSGYAGALRKFAETGDPAAFRGVLISHRDMADALHEISLGADAREVFGQKGKSGRQSKGWYHTTLAAVYWQARVIDGATNAEAAEKARRHFKNVPAPSAQSISRIARKPLYKEHSLDWLERSGHDVARVRAELKSRSKHGKWN